MSTNKDSKILRKLVVPAALCTLIASSIYHNEKNSRPHESTVAPLQDLVTVSSDLSYPPRDSHFDHAHLEYLAHQEEKLSLVESITGRYTSVDVELATEIVELAYQYEQEDFPTARDILAVIAIESSFIPSAKSKLKHDAAVGLMQVRPKVWSSIVDVNKIDQIEYQIKYGVEILTHYYEKVQNDAYGALQAYNVGITNYNKGVRAPRYINKFNRELAYIQ